MLKLPIKRLIFSKTHLAGYVKEADNLKDHGIGEIICVAVQDAFVLNAWGASYGSEGKVEKYLRGYDLDLEVIWILIF